MTTRRPPSILMRAAQARAAAMEQAKATAAAQPAAKPAPAQPDMFAEPRTAPAPAPARARPSGLGLAKAPTGAARERQASGEPRFDEIKGKIERVIYETGDFAVYAVTQSKGERTTVTCGGEAKFKKGDKIVAKGSWTTYKGKATFKAMALSHDIPKGARGVVTWLGTRAASGVGKATAEKLAKHFGDRLVEVLTDPAELAKAGIPMAKAEAIAEAWNSNNGQPELVEYLGRFGLGEMTIAKIVRRYGASARKVVKENPWALAETIPGVGFITADEIAEEAGHGRESPLRIKAGIRFSLDEATNRDGHCGLPVDVLIDEARRLLSLRRDLIAPVVDEVIGEGGVILDRETGLVYPKGLHRAESELAERLLRLVRSGPRVTEAKARDAVEAALAELGIERDEGQVNAAVMGVMGPLSIITGGPGTGKTVTQRLIVHALESLGREVVLAAPTGRAAKRLAEVSGMAASTCHRLLSFSSEKGGFEYDASNPFPEDHIVIDEFSMVDLRLGQAFMDAIKPSGSVTIVGDVDQLPSVGAGQVLKDLIDAGTIPVTRLKTVHRQKGDSGIVVAAARINSGEYPLAQGETLTGFEILSGEKDAGSAEITRRTVVELMSKILPGQGYDPMSDIQVLTSMRKGEYGVSVLNEDLKAALNPADSNPSVEVRRRVFSVGDRVMHLRNDYVKKVYNGEVGTVNWVGTRKNKDDKDEPCFRVDYSGYAAYYGPDDVDDVELSFAATVHKSQGCEFPVVVFVCPDAHRRMLTRNLFYTAVTRAKKLCVVVGNNGAIAHAVATADVNTRHTGLACRMGGRRPEPEVSEGPAYDLPEF